MTELDEVAETLQDLYAEGLKAMCMQSTYDLALIFAEQQMEGESVTIIGDVADILNDNWKQSMKIKKTNTLTLRGFAECVLNSIENGGVLSDDVIAILARQALGITEEGKLIKDPYRALLNFDQALFEASISGALKVIQMETQEPHTINDICSAVTVTLRDRLS